MFCASTTVIYQSNAIHTGNDKHAPYVIPLYQLVPGPQCTWHRDAGLTLNYGYLYDTGVCMPCTEYTERCNLLNLESVYNVHSVRHF